MAASNAQQEPTMEEILASIRRIISEDGDDSGQPQAEAIAEDDVADIMEAEVEVEEEIEDDLALADEMPEVEEPAELAAEPEPEPEPEDFFEEASADDDDVLELTDIIEEAPRVEEKPETILSKQAADLAAQPFSQLSGLLVRNYPGSENTLDGLVREMLRPMLKQWLDENLPPLVERMVAKEIARLTNRD